MGTIQKKLAKSNQLEYGMLFLQTYREMDALSDEVIVQLKKKMFQGPAPDEITVTVEWQDGSG